MLMLQDVWFLLKLKEIYIYIYRDVRRCALKDDCLTVA